MNLTQRSKARKIMAYLVAHKGRLHYAQKRPMTLPRYSWPYVQKELALGRPFAADCSETVTAICKWIGARDPNGAHYNGYGSSETMLWHLKHYTNARLARSGAIVHFSNPNHVSMVYKPDFIGGNPLLFSFGSEAGPQFYRLKDERSWHPGPVAFLNVSHL